MAYPKTYERTLALLGKLPTGSKIADLGCGKGAIVEALKKKGYIVSYADLADCYDGKVTIADFNFPLPYKDKSFDAVISTEVIEHLENKYLYLREVARILKKGGIFVFSTPNISNIFNRLVYVLTGTFIEFNAHEHRQTHINPFFLWQIPDFFSIEKVSYNRGWIPLLRLPFFNGKLFGQTIVVRVRLKK